MNWITDSVKQFICQILSNKKKYSVYFNKINSFCHGIMFHHFHDSKNHHRSQGSITADQLIKLINYIGKNNIIDPSDFYNLVKEKKLNSKKVCLTFDDGLKSQFDIAYPILEEKKIKAFFFVYSSIFTKKINYLEIFRDFRNTKFSSIDIFYKYFFKGCEKKLLINLINLKKNKKKRIAEMKKKHPMYSLNDIMYRILRDEIVNKKDFYKLNLDLMKSKKYEIISNTKKLFMNKNNLKTIHNSGHTIGLHSHNHPTKLENLNKKDQFNEYSYNKKFLKNILKDKKYNSNIFSAAHPCGSYNKTTLEVMKKLDISLAFKQIMIKDEKIKKINNSNLEIARQNHSALIKYL